MLYRALFSTYTHIEILEFFVPHLNLPTPLKVTENYFGPYPLTQLNNIGEIVKLLGRPT